MWVEGRVSGRLSRRALPNTPRSGRGMFIRSRTRARKLEETPYRTATLVIGSVRQDALEYSSRRQHSGAPAGPDRRRPDALFREELSQDLRRLPSCSDELRSSVPRGEIQRRADRPVHPPVVRSFEARRAASGVASACRESAIKAGQQLLIQLRNKFVSLAHKS